MKLLVTHCAPDIDAITSVWIFKRFDPQRFADARVGFVPAGTKMDAGVAALEFGVQLEDVVHTDTGLGEFDHHQPEQAMRRVCASSLVYEEVCKTHPEHKDNWALEQIVEHALIDDHFEDYFWKDREDVKHLFSIGPILRGLEFTGMHTDETQLNFGMKCLDGIYAALRERRKAMLEVEEKGITFDSPWGRAIALPTSNQAVLKYAQLLGFNVVIQKDPKTGHVRIKAAPLPEIDLTSLYEKVMAEEQKSKNPGTWFFHNGRHMLLNGSRKAIGRHAPSSLSLETLILLARSEKEA